MAWHFARFTQHVAAAGKAEYPLPMFVNAALDPPGLSAGPVPERRAAAAPARRLAGGRAGDRLHRARHLLPELRRVGAPLRARRQPAVHSRGAARPGCGGERALRVRRARRDRLLAVRDRIDRRAGRRPARGELRRGRPARAADRRSPAAAARWRACCRSIPTTGSRSRSASTATCSAASFERSAPSSLADGVRPAARPRGDGRWPAGRPGDRDRRRTSSSSRASA